jgi:hypothetical protein
LSHQPITSTFHCQSTVNLSLYQPVTDQPIQPVTVTDTQPDPLTWIIYQGHLSTRCPTSPTHASTKHVPISPTYHHKICVSTMYQSMYQTVPYQPVPYQTSASTITHNLYHNKCINHAPTPVPNHASTMHQHLYQTMHQPCTITCTICLNHQPCTSTPYQVPIMYHTMYQPCMHQHMYINNVPYHVPTMYLNHIPYHSIMSNHHTPCTIIYQESTIKVYLKKVPNNQDHIPSICLNHAPNMCLKHVPMPQQYTKDLPQACTITSSTCNPQNMHINIHVTL